MQAQTGRPFPHRLNVRGNYDSVCTECHMTVASAWHEKELAQFEREHVCEPVRLYQLRENPFADRQSVQWSPKP